MRKICLLLLILTIFAGGARAENVNLIKELEAQIAEGDVEAMGQLGELYIQGIEIEQNVALGLKLMHAAIENGNDHTARRLGMIYYRGVYLDRDYAKAYEYLAKSAEKSTLARTALNWLFYNDQPVIVLDEIKVLAESGDIGAQYDLGQLYMMSFEVERNIDESLKWLTKTAENGHTKAQMSLSVIYQGFWGEQYTDPKKMVYWLEKAAAQEQLFAIMLLVGVYSFDQEVEPDFVQVQKWLLKAAEMGPSDAYFDLANFYYDGNLVEQDYAEALRLYLLAAQGGNVSAMQKVADMYGQGLGTTSDVTESQQWRLKEAYAMVPQAQYQLAKIYFEGAKFNIHEAKEWRERAFDEPGLGAIHRLANYQEQQISVEKDMDEALRWYELAALNGHVGAAQFLGHIYGDSADYYGMEQDYSLSTKWYTLVAERQDISIRYFFEVGEAIYTLARMYNKGQGVPRDLVKAYVLAAKAYTIDIYGGMNHYVLKYMLRKALPMEMSKAELENAQALLQAEGIGREQYLLF